MCERVYVRAHTYMCVYVCATDVGAYYRRLDLVDPYVCLEVEDETTLQ